MLQVGEWSAEHRLGRRRPGRLRRASPKGSRSAKENPGAWAPGRLVETGSVRHKKGTPNKLWRSEEHTSELQSLMRNPYAVFCLKKKNILIPHMQHYHNKYTLSRHTT